MLLLDIFYLLGLILLSPWLLLMLVIKPAFREGIGARFVLRDKNTAMPESVWLHGSSAGEIDLLRPLVAEIEQRSGTRNIVVSAFSISGFTAAKKAFPQHRVIYLPADFSPVIKRFLKTLRPVLVVLVEAEFWPNFITTVAKSDIPVCLLNGRMSEKSFQAHKWTRLIPYALKNIALFALQTDGDASRFRELGVPENRLRVTGNMKYDLHDRNDQADRQEVRHALRKRYAIDEGVPVFIGASIHGGEDLALAWAYRCLVRDGFQLRMIIVPRYPADSPAISQVLEKQGLVPLFKSSISGDEPDVNFDPLQVLVVDTIGELKKFYAMSDIAYVGGSLLYRASNKGGHNLMEPAILGLAVMFGPHNYSFRDTVRDLLENRAGLLVHDRDEIVSSIKGLLSEPARIADMGNKARQVILDNRGATSQNFALLEKYMPKRCSTR